MSLLLVLSLASLMFAAVLAIARVVHEGSLVDRVLGVDFFITTVATGLVVGAVVRDIAVFIPIVVVVALLAFVATAAVSRYIERRGA